MKRQPTARTRALAVVLACLLTGCAANAPAPPPIQAPVVPEQAPPAYDGLTIYSALPDDEIPVYLNAFRRDTGIEVTYERLSAGEMIARVQREQDAPQVSVLLGGPAESYAQADAEGLLEPYQSPALSYVPERYLDKNRVWNPIYIGVICFACNEDWFRAHGEPLPDSWDALLAPALRGQIAMASPETSGTSYTVLAALTRQRGERDALRYLRALSDSIPAYTRSGIAPAEQVQGGARAVAVVFSHDGRRVALDGYPIALRYPEDGVPYEIGACALVRGGPAKERENAMRLIDWMTSERGQECYLEAKSSRLPANANARAADGLPEPDALPLIECDPAWAGKNRTGLTQAFRQQTDARKLP